MDATTSTSRPVDRWSVFSLVAAILTVGAVCVGAAPIPLTGFVCFPAAAVLGLLALVSGLWSLHRIRLSAARGREFAVLGMGLGSLVLIVTACFVGLGFWLYPSITDLIHRFIR